MPEKNILVLANSVRHAPNACVAGRELIDHAGQQIVGDWVRPISTHGEGELSFAERQTSIGREVRVLDVVRMSLGEHVPDALQRENWRHVTPQQWPVIRVGTLADLENAAQAPLSIWDHQDDLQDRVSVQRVHDAPLDGSLLLLAVDQVLLRVFYTYYQGNRRKSRRAHFSYRQRDYDLSFTDPNVEVRYGLNLPANGSAVEHHIEHRCFLCISLTHGALHGYHYKLVAALIDPENL